MRLGFPCAAAGPTAGTHNPQAAAREIKEVLGGYLGATLVESSDPLWPDDPAIEDMTVDYTRALAELVPLLGTEGSIWNLPVEWTGQGPRGRR